MLRSLKTISRKLDAGIPSWNSLSNLLFSLKISQISGILQISEYERGRMATIEIDFDVFKALTNRRATEETTYNAVLRELLKLPSGPNSETVKVSESPKKAWTWKGTTLPHGTQLRAEYKGQAYMAEIVDGRWVQNGKDYGSPSAAASMITGSGINGWWFWSAKKPGENGWTALGKLRPGESGQQVA